MFRRSRIPISSVQISDPEESRQHHQFTPPGLQSDFEKALHIHQSTSISKPEPNPERLTPAEGPKAVPPRLQALLRLDHLLRPSPLLSSKVERRIVSEPFGRAPQWSIEEDLGLDNYRDRGRRPFLSKSDQRPTSSSRNQLIKVQGLKSRYSAQVSDNDSDSHYSRDTHQSDTTSSKKTYRYNRSWAPSPPSSFSSITTDGDYKRNSSPSFIYSDGGVPSNDTEEYCIPQYQQDRKSPHLVSEYPPKVGSSGLISSPLASLPAPRSPDRVSWRRRQKPYPDHVVQARIIDSNKEWNPTPTTSEPRKHPINRKPANNSTDSIDANVKPNVAENLPLDTIIASLPLVPRPSTRENFTSHPLSTTRNLRALSEPPPITKAYVPKSHTQAHFKSPADLSNARRKAATSRMEYSPENQRQTRPHKSLSHNPDNQTLISHIDSSGITKVETPLNPQKSLTGSLDPLRISIKPISTQGLSPVMKSLNYGLLQLALPDSDLNIEPFDGLEVRFWLKKEAINHLGSESGDLIVIKQDGQTVQWMMRSPDFSSKVKPANLETSVEKSIPLATFYHLSALPTYLIKLLKYIERNLELIRSHTPLFIFRISSLKYFQGAKCLVMMNGENPDIVIDWTDIQKIKISRKKHKVIVWNRDRDVEGYVSMSKMTGSCDEEGKIGDEIVKELREGFRKLEGGEPKEIGLLDDRLDCSRRCIEMSNTILNVFKGGGIPRGSKPVTVDP